ncbi:MAG TPA: hypothetical protein VLA66_14310 [Thermoanaerobaculia bacterium]|nr:hypothetical protein [Thermoanaerobaculia bacterium]
MSAPAGARWVATCAAGLEEILEREVAELDLDVEGRETGGVVFRGDLADAVRANWRLRTANRILAELASWPAPDDEALYRGAYQLIAGARATTPGILRFEPHEANEVPAERRARGKVPAERPPGKVPAERRGKVPAEGRPAGSAANKVPAEGREAKVPGEGPAGTATSHGPSPFSLSGASPAKEPGALAGLLHPSRTFAIAATASRSKLRDTRWIALKVKDAIADAQRARWGRRASVERRDPDLALRLRLHSDRATLLIDTSGEPLDHRGYRVETTEAPLREQLAAAAILASGWDGAGPVVDLFCGSGTLLAEAGALALGLAPNRLRARWGFERLPGWDPAILDAVRAEALPAPGPGVTLHGVDLDPRALAAARRNLSAAGLAQRAVLHEGDGLAFDPPEGPGLVVANPPWGERLEEGTELWRRLGDRLKQSYRGWRAVIVAGGPDRGKHLGLRPARRIPVRSGPLEARLLVLELW